MPILSKDDFFARIKARIGDDTSDDAISFLEDMTDTYSDFETRLQGGSENWEQKYKANDEAWRRRYQSRFFSGLGGNPPAQNQNEDSDPTDVDFEDLFKEGE